MALNVGSLPVNDVRVGEIPVREMYVGSKLVWKSGPTWIHIDDFNKPDGYITGPYTFTPSSLRYYSGAAGGQNNTTRYARCNIIPTSHDIVVRATIRTGSNTSDNRKCGIRIGDSINDPSDGPLTLVVRANMIYLTYGDGFLNAIWTKNYNIKNGDVIELSRKGTEVSVNLNGSTLWTGNSTIATSPESLYGGFFGVDHDGVMLDDFMLGVN